MTASFEPLSALLSMAWWRSSDDSTPRGHLGRLRRTSSKAERHMARNQSKKATGDSLGEDYVVRQAGFLLLELSKMMDIGSLDPNYEKARKSAMRAALRAAKVLDNMSPDGTTTLDKIPMPEE